MKSMTGYGRGKYSLEGREITVELRSVNHRYSEVSVKLPRNMNAFEDALRKYILERVSRGKIDVYVRYSSSRSDDVSLSVNLALVGKYIEAFNIIKDTYDIRDDIKLSHITKNPDIFNLEKDIENNESDNEIKECLLKAAQEAVNMFVAMRETEGAVLKNNITEKLKAVAILIDVMEKKSPDVVRNYEARLKEKINDLKDINIDESRLAAEVLLFSDKVCIDEEITRLKSHVSQMYAMIDEDIPIGRKLDFLVQEMNRETNTIGAKANDLVITKAVIDIKSELEKIREQVQNIE